jgi:DNA-binding CsgD family transcriptional regulator
MGDDVRVGDADREQAIDRLQHHCGLGRISLDELLQRTAQAQTVATRAELDALLGDLPADERQRAGLRDPAWRVHAVVATAFTTALTGLWLLTRDATPAPTDEGIGYWWPLWVTLIWAMLLVLHYLVAAGRLPLPRLPGPRPGESRSAESRSAESRSAESRPGELGPREPQELPAADGAPERVGVPPRLTMLTDREREVLALVGMACSNQEIARRLTISERTARTHVSNILQKLGLSSRTEAALVAVRAGLVPPA